MNQKITAQGLVATTPRHLVTATGMAITSFRIACSTKKFDEVAGKWIEGETNWYTVTAFNALAVNAQVSIQKGDRIVITGNLKVRDWDNGDRAGTSVEIEADSIGHDLVWGTSKFERVAKVNFTPAPQHNCTCTDCDE